MITHDNRFATKLSQMYISATRILLEAGSGTALLLKPVMQVQASHPQELLVFEAAQKYRNQLRLRAALTELLVKHKYCEIFTVLKAAKELVEVCESMQDNPVSFYPCSEAMDILGDIFLYFVLAQADSVATELQNIINHAYDFAVEAFIYTAGYSSQPGHSKKLLRMILSAMNTSTVSRLKCVLSEPQRAIREMNDADEFPGFTAAALKYIQGMETPFSLQVLSRSAFNRAIATGKLNTELLSTAEIPVNLKKYVLHQD